MAWLDNNHPMKLSALVLNTLTLAVIYLLIGLVALARPYIPIDETRYISVAWEMWQHHQFLVPHMNGTPYSDKPPLLFWLIHLGWQLFGVNDTWPKLISPLAALVAQLHLLRIARRLGDADYAWKATLILAATLLWLTYSGVMMFDVLLTACVLGTILPLVSFDSLPARNQWLEAGVWLGLGLGWGLGWGLLAVAGLLLSITGKPLLREGIDPIGALLLLALAIGSVYRHPRSTTGTLRSMVLLNILAWVLAAYVMLGPLWSAYDIGAPSRVITDWQADGKAVSIADFDYQATFGFAGRLAKPLQEIDEEDIQAWSQRHPDGLIVTTVKDASTIPADAQAFRYRGRWLVLREARHFLTASQAIPP
ncbi:Dolichyl-phosphate-mannose-protein mannosyltransferase [Modicisalibacter ilicicola DSM 19980]|uniref:Dolichyl-phosphate-mannose-protein mannosyltransferase n=1 Tax=Modicisalibacter ilicicola DSM 19980 TaxID=1121942 RepID=A0A1M5DN22_9GAMM|nr:glycosyltransferase family 39 protein [Halomonas ilicicola]SHF68377.1 Dolichyl-phosphate-mannose-protein mannosyltransferase [Halomonas ilicicola DSM 19980]